MHTHNNYKRIMVARNCNRTSGLTSANLNEKLAYGEIVVVDKGGSLIDTVEKAQKADAIRFVVGTKDKSPVYSDLIVKKDLNAVISSKFAQKRERKVIIGYDGSAGSIDVVPGNTYAVEVDHSFNGTRTSESFLTRASYESLASGDYQFNIAQKLAQVLALDYAPYSEGVRVNIIGSEAGAAGATGAEVVHGSRTISYTGGSAPSIGQVVVVPGITGEYFRDEDDTMYLVTYVDTVNHIFEIDRPYQNRSQSGIDLATIADPTTGDYGLTLEGMHLTQKHAWESWEIMQFDVTIFNFFNTIKQDSGALAGNSGFGRHEEVLNLEDVFGTGMGRNNMQAREFQSDLYNTDIETGYSAVAVVFDHLSKDGGTGIYDNHKMVEVFLQRGTYTAINANAASTEFKTNIKDGSGLIAAGDSDSFLNVLNAFAVSAGVLESGANTTSNGGNEITAGTTFNSGIDV